MAAPRNRRHLLVREPPAVEAYGRPPRGGSSTAPPAPPGGRPAHGTTLRNALQQAERDAQRRRAAATVADARPGIYVEFESFPGWDLALKSFEQVQDRDPHQHVEVVAVRTDVIPATATKPETTIQRATVFVPDGKVARFVRRFETYASTASSAPTARRHHNFVDRISSLRLATVQALWTDDPAVYPADDQAIWWEVWLRKTDGQELRRFSEYAALASIKLGRRRLEFDDRIVLLAYATPRGLAASIDILDDVAEFRKAKELATFFVDESPAEQADWVRDDERYDAWTPLAPSGELSPYSTTSVGFATPWPVKPDIVMEGGNIGINGSDEIHDEIPDLLPLTTYYKPQDKPLVTTWGTSAACSSAARLCARVMADYPTLWSETVRGLVVHASRWTSVMYSHLQATADTKAARARLLRRYGYGIPDEARALRSANDALTLIAQGTIRPFEEGSFRDMHVYQLPWPVDVLASLGESEVQLRVTLSYFIEPNPARRGWQARHRYQSHALRFEVKRPLESANEFRKRINQLALAEGEQRPESTGDEGWFFGARAREHGSVHSDYWTGTAAALAERSAIGIHPVTGWWKEQKRRDRSAAGARYALLVSIETPGVETDIWTPVAQRIGVPIEIVI